MLPDHSLRTIADLQPGDHLCCLYETEDEHRALLTPYLRIGLERHQKVLYIVDAHNAEVVLGHLREDGLDVDTYLANGQLNILTADEAYLCDGAFDPDRMIALLQSETERALADGYTALRVTGEMTWALRGLAGAERLIEYEARLNNVGATPGSLLLNIRLLEYDLAFLRLGEEKRISSATTVQASTWPMPTSFSAPFNDCTRMRTLTAAASVSLLCNASFTVMGGESGLRRR